VWPGITVKLTGDPSARIDHHGPQVCEKASPDARPSVKVAAPNPSGVIAEYVGKTTSAGYRRRDKVGRKLASTSGLIQYPGQMRLRETASWWAPMGGRTKGSARAAAKIPVIRMQ